MFIEVKCFHSVGKYKREDLYTAMRQYIAYRTIMKFVALNTDLYLAIPSDVYAVFNDVIRCILKANDISLLVVDLAKEEITEWIK